MSDCDVAVCHRRATVRVHWASGGSTPYCEFHSYRRTPEGPRLRWASKHVASVEAL